MSRVGITSLCCKSLRVGNPWWQQILTAAHQIVQLTQEFAVCSVVLGSGDLIPQSWWHGGIRIATEPQVTGGVEIPVPYEAGREKKQFE